MPQETIQLDFVTTDELMQELANRSDALVIAGQFKSETGSYRVRSFGSGMACMGLTAMLKRRMIQWFDAQSKAR